jgi:FkbM family methyltransferase
VFFDIGANAGMVTLETRAMLGDSIFIYAFEPQPTLARSLRRSLDFNSYGNVKVIECLLGDAEGSGELYLTSHAIHASVIPRESHFTKISLPVHRIDTLVDNGSCAPARGRYRGLGDEDHPRHGGDHSASAPSSCSKPTRT